MKEIKSYPLIYKAVKNLNMALNQKILWSGAILVDKEKVDCAKICMKSSMLILPMAMKSVIEKVGLTEPNAGVDFKILLN